jgi:hypothetical protein
MRLQPRLARDLLPLVDPGRVVGDLPVGLRDGALLALVAAGLSAIEIASLEATAVRSVGGHVVVKIYREDDVICSFELPTHLGARVMAWLSDRRIWATAAPVFAGQRGPLSDRGVCHVIRRYMRRGRAR